MKYYLYQIKIRVIACIQYLIDYKYHIKYSVFYHTNRNLSKDMIRCKILLLDHQLEKAQTYTEQKVGYGKDKIITLQKLISTYYTNYGYDELVQITIGVIESHIRNPYSFKSEDLKSWFADLIKKMPTNDEEYKGGTIVCNPKEYIRLDFLLEFLQQRHSCRSYSEESITEEEITRAVKYAQAAPSACNRQPVRAHFYSDKEIIKNIVLAQKSDVNWCLNAKGLFIISANKSYTRDFYERNQTMFDSGLFSMNLVLGLHNEGIGSCFKMAQKLKSIDDNTKKIAGIPKDEDISVLILVGKYPKIPMVIAKSKRLPIDSILSIH